MTFATLDSGCSLSANVALSGGNLTATNSNVGGVTNIGACAAMFPKLKGKWYFECVTNFAQANSGVGVRGPGLTWANDIAAADGAYGCFPSGSYVNGTLQIGSIGTTSGHTQSICYDGDNALGWARNNGGNWNSNPSADPATGIGGHDLSGCFPGAGAFPFCMVTGATESAVFNFGASAFTYTVPTGFSAWDGTNQPKVWVDVESAVIASTTFNVTTKSFNANCGGASRKLLVFICTTKRTGPPAVTSVTSSGLTFTQLTSFLNWTDGTFKSSYEVWQAECSAAFTGQSVTVNWATNIDVAVITSVSVTGYTVATPSDANSPWTNTGTGTSASVSVTTANANDLVFAIWAQMNTSLTPAKLFITAPEVNLIGALNGAGSDWLSTQLSVRCLDATISGHSMTTINYGSSVFWGMMAVALQQAPVIKPFSRGFVIG